MTRTHEYWCWTCLDFEHLPAIGPCPECRPDAYTEHITAWIDEQTSEGREAA